MEKEWEKFRDIVMECTNDVSGMKHVGRQRRGVNGGMKNGWGGGRKEKSFREEIGLPMTDTGHREWLCNGQLNLQKEWRFSNGESD